MLGGELFSSPICGISIVSRSSKGDRNALPCNVLIRSALTIDVDNPLAISFVMCLPPSGMQSVNTTLPSKNIAIVVVPPPISTTVAPRSISSSTKQAKPEAYGDTTKLSAFKWHLSTTTVEFLIGPDRAVTMCIFADRF